MNDFQSIAAPVIVIVTAVTMIYCWRKKKGGSCCSDGCSSIKPGKPSKKP